MNRKLARIVLTLTAAAVPLVGIVSSASPASASTTTYTDHDLKSMVDLCVMSGGTGGYIKSTGTAVCIGKNSGVTYCENNNASDNCTSYSDRRRGAVPHLVVVTVGVARAR